MSSSKYSLGKQNIKSNNKNNYNNDNKDKDKNKVKDYDSDSESDSDYKYYEKKSKKTNNSKKTNKSSIQNITKSKSKSKSNEQKYDTNLPILSTNIPSPPIPKSTNQTLKLNFDDGFFSTPDGKPLNEFITQLFHIAKTHFKPNIDENSCKGIIVPHAGLEYSGLCAATGYYSLTYNHSTKIKNIILLCTNHQAPELIIPSSNIIQSFNNIFKTDEKIMNQLKKFIKQDNIFFENEHSFKVQLPFIEKIAPHAKLIPILIGHITNFDKNSQIHLLFNILNNLVKQKDTVVICTSDLTHANDTTCSSCSKFNYYIYNNVRKNDSDILEFIFNKFYGIKGKNAHIDFIDNNLFLNNTSSCGIIAMIFFAKLMQSYSNYITSNSGSSSSSSSSGSNNSSTSSIILTSSNLSNNNNSKDSNKITNKLSNNKKGKKQHKRLYPRIACYYNSANSNNINYSDFHPEQCVKSLNITNPNQKIVGYASVIFTSTPYISTIKHRKLENLLTQYEKYALIQTAKEQLENSFVTNKSNVIPYNLLSPISCPVFKTQLGTFVTLYNNGRLRGCIGTNETDNSIEENVRSYVIESAYRDSRFENDRITPGELNQLTYSISLLYNIMPISLEEYFGSKFVLGKDGIEIRVGNLHGYYLPSVATEFKMNKQTLLESLCQQKAHHSSKQCYQLNNVKLFYNEGVEFSSELL